MNEQYILVDSVVMYLNSTIVALLRETCTHWHALTHDRIYISTYMTDILMQIELLEMWQNVIISWKGKIKNIDVDENIFCRKVTRNINPNRYQIL